MEEAIASLGLDIVKKLKHLRSHDIDDSGASNPDRYDDEGKRIREQIDTLRRIRQDLENALLI